MKVRRAELRDEAAWRRVWQESARAGFGDLLPADHHYPAAPPGRWRELVEDPGVSVLVAEGGGEVVGYTACGENRDADAGSHVGEVRTMFVAPDNWRGGVGRALLAAALEDLRERGYSGVTLWSFAGNELANAFYESAGFARDGAERTEEVWASLPEVRYRRSL